MNIITSKIEFDQIASNLAGKMVSLDSQTRADAAIEAELFLENLPKFLKNSPHCKSEISALNKLISKNK